MTNGAAQAGFGLLTNAMLGDVADLDEWHTGLRREALFSSLLSWFEKAGKSLGSLVAGFVLVWIGFDAKFGAQGPATLAAMQWAYAITPAAGALLALWLIRRYDLTEARAYEVKDALTRRRAAAP
jgi:GPH family glycoside/pentoside/hexuronide:cation symporter